MSIISIRRRGRDSIDVMVANADGTKTNISSYRYRTTGINRTNPLLTPSTFYYGNTNTTSYPSWDNYWYDCPTAPSQVGLGNGKNDVQTSSVTITPIVITKLSSGEISVEGGDITTTLYAYYSHVNNARYVVPGYYKNDTSVSFRHTLSQGNNIIIPGRTISYKTAYYNGSLLVSPMEVTYTNVISIAAMTVTLQWFHGSYQNDNIVQPYANVLITTT